MCLFYMTLTDVIHTNTPNEAVYHNMAALQPVMISKISANIRTMEEPDDIIFSGLCVCVCVSFMHTEPCVPQVCPRVVLIEGVRLIEDEK